MIQASDIQQRFLEQLQYEPTTDQQTFIEKLSVFLLNRNTSSVFVLKGYAGTGKTTMVSTLVKVLPILNAQIVLLAPTGRAAKVLASYAGCNAFTIHRKIYKLKESAQGGGAFVLMPNKHTNTLFVVDEASMISEASAQTDGNYLQNTDVLGDLMSYVFSGDNCKLILIGDNAQLPPVGMQQSPALDLNYLKARFYLDIDTCELTQVVRQEKDSGILENATKIRHKIHTAESGFIKLNALDYADFVRLENYDAADAITSAFSSRDFENSIIVVRSNKRAKLFNNYIRQNVLYREEEISAGDLLMVVKNNYFWLPAESKAGFIANGDIIEVRRIFRIEELYGFRFAHISATLLDYPDEPELEVTIILDTLQSDEASLSYEDQLRLYREVEKDYMDEPGKQKRLSKIRKNPHLNALKVKFAYCLTCHKAQGGQWENVFVEMGFIPNNVPDYEYYRWLYTSFTRATQKLYLMNFVDDFF